MTKNKQPGVVQAIVDIVPRHYDPQIRVDTLEVPGLTEPVFCATFAAVHEALEPLMREESPAAGVVQEIYFSVFNRMSNVAAIQVQLVPQKAKPSPPEVSLASASIIYMLLTEARNHIFRAAQELRQTDPSYQRLLEFAEEVQAEKIKLCNRCKEGLDRAHEEL